MTIHAAGIVLYDKAEPHRYLLLRNARHGTWGFPKGHLDGEEDTLDTARREVLEETGYADVVIDPRFSVVVSYPVTTGKHAARYVNQGGIKTTLYYLAAVRREDFRISNEHDEARWLTYDEARSTLQFDSLRELLDLAHEHLGRAAGETP